MSGAIAICALTPTFQQYDKYAWLGKRAVEICALTPSFQQYNKYAWLGERAVLCAKYGKVEYMMSLESRG